MLFYTDDYHVLNISICMEKVMDSGLMLAALVNVQGKAEGQFLCGLNQFEKDKTEMKKKDIEERKKMNDYQAFMKKCRQTNKNRFPSIFNIIQIQNRTINWEKDGKNMESSTFPLLGLGNSDLIDLCCKLILQENAQEFYEEKDLRILIKHMSDGYNIASYHSFTHGVSLMHLLQDCFRKDKSLKNLFSAEERNFCMIAAIAHDINHPGTNNAFENKMNTEWSILAQGQGTLEKMHVRYLFDILRADKRLNLENYTKDPLLIKQLITRSILSTDISKHFSNLEKLKSFGKNCVIEKEDHDTRYLLMENLFHACDIGNPCLPYKEYMNWAALVVYEFNNQTELEAQNNLQITEFLVYKGRKNFYLGQSNFINIFIYPLWKQLSINWPGLNPFIHNICINLAKLKLSVQKQPIQDQSQFFIEMP